MWNVLAQVPLTTAVVVTALLSGACAAQSAVGPSPVTPEPAPTLPAPPVNQDQLTVRVLNRDSEVPIPGAVVHAAETHILTDASGTAIVPVVAGTELEVNVSAAGYQSMVAGGVLGPRERWTFYLQAVQ